VEVTYTWYKFGGHLEKTLKVFVSYPFRSCHKMLCGFQTSYSPRNLSKFRWSPSPSKLEGHVRLFFGRFPLFMKQAICAPTKKKSYMLGVWGVYLCPRRFLGTIGQNSRASKSNQLQVQIFQFFFINFRYVLLIPLEWSMIFPKSQTLTGYFSNSNGSFVVVSSTHSLVLYVILVHKVAGTTLR
jgi:hypothetical protein